jgi:CRP-like cAMP-binding protein
MEAGFASIVAGRGEARGIEVGLIGSEGVTGAAIILGNHRSPNATYVQAAGSALRISAAELRIAMDASPSLRAMLLRFVQTFMIQTSRTAIANGRANLDERLARWLLMASDRMGSAFPLTHEFIATMLGVRRAGVTEALKSLTGEGLVRSQQGQIQVLDRRAMERRAGRSYGVPEAEYRRLIG